MGNQEIPGLVIGLDIALRATGICIDFIPTYSSNRPQKLNLEPWQKRLTFNPESNKAKKVTPDVKIQRLRNYYTFFSNPIDGGEIILDNAEMILVEDYAYGVKKSKSLTGFGEQRGLFYAYLIDHDLMDRVIVVTPGTLKKFGCGKGMMDKEIFVQKIALKYKTEFDNSHECDAFVLATLGQAILQWKREPGRGQINVRPKLFQPDHLTLYETQACLGSESIRSFLGVDKKGLSC